MYSCACNAISIFGELEGRGDDPVESDKKKKKNYDGAQMTGTSNIYRSEKKEYEKLSRVFIFVQSV